MPERIDHTLRDRWSAEPAELPRRAGAVVAALLGGPGEPPSEPPGDAPQADDDDAPGVLPPDALAALRQAVGAEHVHTDRAARAGRAGGLSYLDLLRRRLGGEHLPPLPDAVVTPADHDQVQDVLTACRRHDVAVVPFGGGTSVVGGVDALRGGKAAVVALDVCRLDELTAVDEESRLATLQAGVTGLRAEQLLQPHGLTIGHLPQSFERATIGGFAATRSAGQASCGYGRFEDMVQAVRLATPAGEWRLGRGPASAAGPDLIRLVLGSEGAFAVVTEVTVRVRPSPRRSRYEGVVLDGWEHGVRAVRALAQEGALADVTRLADLAETDLGFALSRGARTSVLHRYLRARGVHRPCLLILGWDADDRRQLAARRAATRRVLRRLRAVPLGGAAGRAWRAGRFAGPRQRDALMAAGVCVETVETAAHWSALAGLYGAVRAALAGALPAAVILCHLSHAYETGASLYFTVLARRDGQDPVGQWAAAKRAASAAISGSGGTITHHHAVGVDHLPWLAAEIGDLGVDVLRAVKRVTDPTGILNPGKLVEPPTA